MLKYRYNKTSNGENIMGIATTFADSLQTEISMIHNITDSSMTDAELCRHLRKILNRASKELTVEINDLDVNGGRVFPKITNRF